MTTICRGEVQYILIIFRSVTTLESQSLIKPGNRCSEYGTLKYLKNYRQEFSFETFLNFRSCQCQLKCTLLLLFKNFSQIHLVAWTPRHSNITEKKRERGIKCALIVATLFSLLLTRTNYKAFCRVICV